MTPRPVIALADCRTIAQAAMALNGMLRDAGIEDHESDSRRLVCAAFGIASLDLILKPDSAASSVELDTLKRFARRRLAREPVTRILGTRGFWNVELTVYPDVLDPRPDTEAIVEAAIEGLGARIKDPLTILDAGAGSGAIIAALLSECHAARGWAVDVSEQAAAAARGNLTDLGLIERASVLHQSWTAPLPTQFDLVVSNPPYIETDQIAELDPEVRDFDPRLALDGGADGLDAYRSIASLMKAWLKRDGLLVVEIGAEQAAPVKQIFESAGARLRGSRQDYAGRERALVWAREVI